MEDREAVGAAAEAAEAALAVAVDAVAVRARASLKSSGESELEELWVSREDWVEKALLSFDE